MNINLKCKNLGIVGNLQMASGEYLKHDQLWVSDHETWVDLDQTFELHALSI